METDNDAAGWATWLARAINMVVAEMDLYGVDVARARARIRHRIEKGLARRHQRGVAVAPVGPQVLRREQRRAIEHVMTRLTVLMSRLEAAKPGTPRFAALKTEIAAGERLLERLGA